MKSDIWSVVVAVMYCLLLTIVKLYLPMMGTCGKVTQMIKGERGRFRAVVGSVNVYNECCFDIFDDSC